MVFFNYYRHNKSGDIMFFGSLEIIVKGFISLFFLFLIIKLLGKKQVSQLNVFDYVIGISLGNIAAEMTINSDITIIHGFMAMAIYGFCSLFVSYITNKSIVARRLISGVPVVLIEHGMISKEQLKKVKLDLNDLMQDAREDGIFDLSKVEYAIMEVSGKVTFLLKSENEPVTAKDLKIIKETNSLNAVLIMDGKIMVNNLKSVNKTPEWLMKKIMEHGYKKVDDVFLFLLNHNDIAIYDKNYKIHNNILE